MAEVSDIPVRRKELERRFPEWPGWTLAQAFDAAADQYPDRALFTNEQGTRTYAEMQIWSRRIALGLIAFGIEPGDHVALLMANYAEFVAVKLAIARVGGVTIPVNFNLRGEELRYVLDQSDAVALITMDQFRGHDYLADLDRFAPEWRSGRGGSLNQLREVFVFPTSGVQPLGARTLDDLIALGIGVDPTELDSRTAAGDPKQPCDVLYTSGTTGRSKGVILTHDMILRVAFSSVYHRALSDGRSTAHALPMYHVYGYVECLVVAWFVGGGVVTQLAFEPAAFLDQAETHRVTDIIALPNQTIKLLELAAARGFDSSNLIQLFNSGGVNPPGIWEDIRAIFKPAELITAYGMSETTASSVCSLPEGDDHYLHVSNGRYKMAHVAGDPAFGGLVAVYKVIDPETGDEMPHGEIGELVARGPIVTAGYYRKPEETAAAFTHDGWLHTGDLGKVTAEGYLTLTGRLKESYRCGGEMVMPREIEALVETVPEVELALAVGVPDMKMGDVGCLCIVPVAGAQLESSALIALCAANLARFKVPRHVLFFAADEIPMTSTGRPQKVKLAQVARARLETESVAATPVAAQG
ncbi:MAG: class I adenylate-forming enzyme family protein [Pseudomonadota bacterium]